MLTWWHQSNRLPVIGEVVFYLVGLPVGLCLTYWLLKRLIKGTGEATGTAAAAGGVAQPDAGLPARATPPRADQLYRLAILGASARAPLGADLAAISGAALEGKRAALDDELVDANGFPVFAARAGALDIEQTYDGLLDQAHDVTWRDEQIRSLAMLAGVLEELILNARAVSEQTAGDVMLRARVMVAADWSDEARENASAWLRNGMLRHWPEASLTLDMAPAGNAAAALAEIDRISTALNHQAELAAAPQAVTADGARQLARPAGPREIHLLAAGDSAVSEATIVAWEAAGTLFGANRKHGYIPGEAAVGLLLALPTAEQAGGVTLARAALAVREQSADSNGNGSGSANGKAASSATTLEALTRQALAAAAIDAEAVGAVVGDGGAHSTRAGEFTQLTGSCFPALELNTDCLALDAGCGRTGAAALLAIAVGAHLAAARERPALIASLAASLERGVMVALPPAPQTL